MHKLPTKKLNFQIVVHICLISNLVCVIRCVFRSFVGTTMKNETFAINFHFAVYYLLIVPINRLDVIPVWRKWIIYNTHAQYVPTRALLKHCKYTKSVQMCGPGTCIYIGHWSIFRKFETFQWKVGNYKCRDTFLPLTIVSPLRK